MYYFKITINATFITLHTLGFLVSINYKSQYSKSIGELENNTQSSNI